MDCKPICDARVETTVSSLYIATWPQVTHFLTLWRLLLGVHFCLPITIRLQNRLGCYGMTYFKGSYIEASFFKTTFNFRHCSCCKVPPSIGRPMDRRYFNRVATSTIFFKNFSTNFFFGLYFGLFRRLPIRGTIFSEALNSEDFLCNSVLWKQNSSIVRYFTKGTSVIRSPVMTKTGWLKCQWCGASPLLDDSPLLGCRGRIWETYIILTQMGCKSICDARVETTVSSLYIAAWPQPCCKGYNRRWHTLLTLDYLCWRSAYEV